MERPTIVVTHNAGFYSCSTVRLMKIIDFHNTNKILPIVNSSNQWAQYKDFGFDDITEKFFKKNVIFDFEPEKMIFCETENQFSDYSFINYPYIGKLINIYFSPSDEVLEKKNFLIKKYEIDVKNTIVVYYRGNDKFTETNLPSYEEMLDKVKEITDLNPNKKLLVQTDEINFFHYIKNIFPNCISIEENKMIEKSTMGVHFTLKNGEKISSAQLLLSTILILSDCSHLIMNSSNVSMWICLYRGNSNNIYQYLNPKDRYVTNKWLN